MATKGKQELVLDFTFKNETTNTIRFTELDGGKEAENPLMGKIYLKKKVLEEWDSPKELEVIVRPKR